MGTASRSHPVICRRRGPMADPSYPQCRPLAGYISSNMSRLHPGCRCASMRFVVRPMRLHGRRLPWRDVINRPGFTGDLRTYELQTASGVVRGATLANPHPAARALLPDLYEPVLTKISPQAIELRGFERHEGADGAYTVMQEWHCELP